MDCDPSNLLLKTIEESGVSSNSNVGIYILLLIILIAINAYFAASELAIVSLNDVKLEKMANEGNKKALLLYEMTQRPTAFLSTIQIGVTLSGFLSSAVAADTFADYIVILFSGLNVDPNLVRVVSIFLITILLSFITLVFGELLPKRLAMKDPEKIAFKVAGSLNIINKILKPIVVLVSKCVDAIAKLLGINENDNNQEYSEEEIRIMVDAGNEKGFIESEEKEMINNVFDFNDRSVDEIITHRKEIDALDINSNIDTILKTFKESGKSRLPVYKDNIDEIVGVVHIKDLIDVFLNKQNKNKFSIKKYMRKPLFVYENMKCDELFDKMQKSKTQLAIVLDEHGGTLGIVTMEDLLESIVGDIQDEFDDEEEEIRRLNKNHYLVMGTTTIDDIEKLLDKEIDDNDNTTISGLMIDRLGYIPKKEEKPELEIEGYIFKVIEVEDNHISSIEISKKN